MQIAFLERTGGSGPTPVHMGTCFTYAHAVQHDRGQCLMIQVPLQVQLKA